MDKPQRGRPKTQIKLHKRTVSFPPQLYAQLAAIAAREERTVNELIVTALRDLVRSKDTN